MFFGSSLSSFLASCVCYYILAPRFSTTKQKAWIITFLSSTAMSIASLPFLRDFLTEKADLLAVRHRVLLARAICGSFQGFLLSDLVVGSIAYPSHVSPTYGWAHHTIYALLLPYITRRGWSHLFSLALSMEIPTCLLATSFLWPRLRNDLLYISLFFCTRIALHAVLLLETVLPRGRNEVVGGSFAPSCLFMLAFIMHASWFMSSAKSTIRRVRASSRSPTALTSLGLQKSTIAAEASQELKMHIDCSDGTIRIDYFDATKIPRGS